MKKILLRIRCYFGGHDWTCKAGQGLPPEINESFQSYARTYCGRCGKMSELNKRLDSLNLPDISKYLNP